MTTPMPGFAASPGPKSLVDRLAKLEHTIRNMQKTPVQAPVSTDLHLYGDQISSGPRYLASPVSWATASTSGQLYSQYLGALPNDMVFTSLGMYTSTANAASATLGLFAGSSLSAMTQLATVAVTVADTTVSNTAFSAPIAIPRATFVVVVLRLNTGASLPILGAFSPSSGGVPGLTGAGKGTGCAKFATTGSAMPTTADFTTGWTSLTNNLWVALA